MRHLIVTFMFVISALSCTKDNKLDTYTKDDSVIWPLRKGHSWTYGGFLGYSDNGSKDTADLVLEIDSTILIDGREHFSLKGDYDNWYRLGKAQVYVSDATGDNKGLLASHVAEELVIYEETGTYQYFESAVSFTGTLTRTAYPDITVINTHSCFRVQEVYKDEQGSVVQRRIVFYAIDKGPMCFKYYGNRETPGSADIYLMLQYTIESMVILKDE